MVEPELSFGLTSTIVLLGLVWALLDRVTGNNQIATDNRQFVLDSLSEKNILGSSNGLGGVPFTGMEEGDDESILIDIASQKEAYPPPKLPLRDLNWGQINFLHTTDIHGWLAGHILEPSFSADWGDYMSFISHMRRKADEKGVDLIVIDSGDHHDGTGLSDATVVDGDISQEIFKLADIDFVTVGNHELYKCDVSEQTYNVLRPHYKGRYLSSNVDLILKNGQAVPMGSRFYKFQTKNQGIRVMAFGFLFDFTGNCNNTRVTFVEEAVQQDWFQQAIRDEDIDMFLLVAHFPVRYWAEVEIINNAIRKVRGQDIPIQFFGGHSHVRDFTVLDKASTALQSGRFLETVGWLSIEGFDVVKEKQREFLFTRKYIDFNLHSFTHHSNTSLEDKTFHTLNGVRVSQIIGKERKRLNLTRVLGKVPVDYLLNRAPYPGPNSLLSLLEDYVLPTLEGKDPGSQQRPHINVINSGSLRFDLFKGNYTVDSSYMVSPFYNDWDYIPGIPYSLAKVIIDKLNDYDHVLGVTNRSLLEGPTDFDARKKNEQEQDQNVGGEYVMVERVSDNVNDNSKARIGYVTYDDYGADGDDTEHIPEAYHLLPNVIGSKVGIDQEGDSEQLVDFVFLDFMKSFILNVVDPRVYGPLIEPYGGLPVKDLLNNYIQTHWPAPGSDE